MSTQSQDRQPMDASMHIDAQRLVKFLHERADADSSAGIASWFVAAANRIVESERQRSRDASKLNHASALTVELRAEVRALQGKLDTIRGDRDLGIKRLGELQSRLGTAVDALRRHGYRETCDIPACNCGDQWNHGGHARERLRELADVLYENGKTPLQVAESLVSRLDVVSKEVEGMEVLLEKEHNDLLAWKHRATSAEDKLDSALAVLRRISEYTEGAASGVGYQCKGWADAFLGGAVEKSRAVSMKAGREPDPPKGCTVADPQAYSDDKSRQPSPFVVERQPPNVCSRCKIHPRTSPLLCDHCIEELGHA